MDVNLTAQQKREVFFNALRTKHNKAAVLKEVTIPDEEAILLERAYHAKRSPYYRRYYDKKGLDYSAELPDDYDTSATKTTRRIDFLMFDGPEITAVEMKISKADFRRDTDAKRRAWKAVTNRFVYLTPEGLLTPEDIPEGCGLWEYQSGRIVVVKKAKKNTEPEPFPPSMIKYFAWRAFVAESLHPVRRRRSRRK